MTQHSPNLPPSRPRTRRPPSGAPQDTPAFTAQPVPETVALAAPVAGRPPEPPVIPAHPVRALSEALRPLGLLLSAASQGELPWTVTGAFGTPFGGWHFALSSLEDGHAMVRELPAHRQAPSVWAAALAHLKRRTATPSEHRSAAPLLAWTAGYAAARRHFFSSRAAFIPLHAARRQDVPCPYPEDASAEQQDFRVGVGAYLSAVRLGVQDQQLTPFIALPHEVTP